jgi:hypothetical protein
MITEQQAKRNAKLISMIYMVIFTIEQFGRPITYAEIERIMSQQQHCLPTELMQVCQELHSYNAIIAQAERGER